MPAVYVKAGSGAELEEFSLESVEDHAVAELRTAVAERLGVPLEKTCQFAVESSRVVCPSCSG